MVTTLLGHLVELLAFFYWLKNKDWLWLFGDILQSCWLLGTIFQSHCCNKIMLSRGNRRLLSIQWQTNIGFFFHLHLSILNKCVWLFMFWFHFWAWKCGRYAPVFISSTFPLSHYRTLSLSLSLPFQIIPFHSNLNQSFWLSH